MSPFPSFRGYYPSPLHRRAVRGENMHYVPVKRKFFNDVATEEAEKVNFGNIGQIRNVHYNYRRDPASISAVQRGGRRKRCNPPVEIPADQHQCHPSMQQNTHLHYGRH